MRAFLQRTELKMTMTTNRRTVTSPGRSPSLSRQRPHLRPRQQRWMTSREQIDKADRPAAVGDVSRSTTSPAHSASRELTLALTAVGAVASQAALLTALLYYVGWVRAHATFANFG